MKGTITTELFQEVPEIEFQIGYQYFLCNLSNYTKALFAILKSIKSKLPLLQLMCRTDEYEGLRTITQTLRKLLDNVGASSISELTYQLEIALLNADATDIHNQLVHYMNELVDFSERLEAMLKKIDLNKAAILDEESSMRRFDYKKSLDRIMRSGEDKRDIV